MNSVIFGQGYVASILNVGLQRIKDGEIGLEGIPLGNSISKTVEAINIVGAFDLDKKKIGKNLGEVTKDYWDGNIKFDDDYIIEEGYRDNRKGGNVDLEEELERLTDIYERKDAEIFVNTITTES
ncbi:MAG: myo-inositol-1-phosphate synthase, partial [Candidatus Methanolliviera hydrocarbonicum]